MEIILRVYPGKTETESYCNRLYREVELAAKHEPQRYGQALAWAKEEIRNLRTQWDCVTAN